MKLLLSTGMFDTAGLPALLPSLHAAGFRYLEIADKGDFTDTILKALLVSSKENNMEMPNWHLLQISPFQHTKKECEMAIERMKLSMEQGRKIGARNHVLHWDNRFLDRNHDVLWRETIAQWAVHAKELGVRLLMETVPDKPTNERYVPASEIIEFVQAYPSELLSVCLDVNHSNLKEKLPDVVHLLKDRLVSVHISDNDGLGEQHWLPGQGVIDYPSFFTSLDEIDFDGMMVLEVNKWCDKPEELSELKRLYEFAKTLLETKKPHPETPHTPLNKILWNA